MGLVFTTMNLFLGKLKSETGYFEGMVAIWAASNNNMQLMD